MTNLPTVAPAPPPDADTSSPYAVLGLPRTCTAADVRVAWRRIAARLHPDRGGDPEAFLIAQHAFLIAQHAYLVLIDPDRRAHYDATGDADFDSVAIARAAAREIAQMFARSLETGAAFKRDADLIKWMRGQTREALAKIDESLRNLAAHKAKLEGVRGRVERKGGKPNHFALIVDGQIAEIDARIKEAKMHRSRQTMVLAELETYTCLTEVQEAHDVFAASMSDRWPQIFRQQPFRSIFSGTTTK